MSTDIVVQHVELSVSPSAEAIYVVSVDEPRFVGDSGETGVRVEIMPTEIFETRAAEYGIDVTKPGGWDDVLDLVFGAPHVARGFDPSEDPDHLYGSSTVEHARTSLLTAIRGQRSGRRVRGVSGHSESKVTLDDARAIENSGAEDPLEFIKRTAPMSREHIKVKQEFVRRQRNLIRVRRAGHRAHELVDMDEVNGQVRRDMKLTVPERETADDLAARLLGQPGPDEVKTRPGSATPRDENDIPRNRLPPREGRPSKHL